MASKEGCAANFSAKYKDGDVMFVLRTLAVQYFVSLIVNVLDANGILLVSFGSLVVLLFKDLNQLKVGIFSKSFLDLHLLRSSNSSQRSNLSSDFSETDSDDCCGKSFEESQPPNSPLEFGKVAIDSLDHLRGLSRSGKHQLLLQGVLKSQDILNSITPEEWQSSKVLSESFQHLYKCVGSDLSNILSDDLVLKPFTKPLDTSLENLSGKKELHTSWENKQKLPAEHDDLILEMKMCLETESDKVEDDVASMSGENQPLVSQSDAVFMSGTEGHPTDGTPGENQPLVSQSDCIERQEEEVSEDLQSHFIPLQSAADDNFTCFVSDVPEDGNDTHGNSKESCRRSSDSSTSSCKPLQATKGSMPSGNGGMSSDGGDDDGDDDDENQRKSSSLKHVCEQDTIVNGENEEGDDSDMGDQEEEEDNDGSTANTNSEPVAARADAEGIEDKSLCQEFIREDNESKSLNSFKSICKKTTGTDYSWSICSQRECSDMYQMVSHCQSCPLKVLGGCVECSSFRDVLLHHAMNCKDDDCPLPRCQDVRDYIGKNGGPDKGSWSYRLDKVFFGFTTPTTLPVFDTKGSVTQEEVQELIKSIKSEQREGVEEMSIKSVSREEVEQLIKSIKAEQCLHSSGLSDKAEAPPPSGKWSSFHYDRPPDEDDNEIDGLPPNPIVIVEHQFHVRGAFSAPPQEPTQAVATTEAPSSKVSPEEFPQIVFPKVRKKWKKYKRPAMVQWLKPLDAKDLSVNATGQYDEGFEWRSVQHLGGGACGRCFLCIDKVTNFLFAIKKVPKSKFNESELDIWSSLTGQHESILKLYGAAKADEFIILFMEYMEGGSIETILDGWQGQTFDEESALAVIYAVAEGLVVIHSKRVLHRDIKGGNILLNVVGTRVKIGDFGDAFQLNEDDFTQNNIPRGTEAFMPPEVCRSEPYRFSADIWSLGCALYQLLTGEPPWMRYVHGSILYQVALAKEPPELPEECICSQEVQDLLYSMLTLTPEDRPTAREVLKHQAFQSVDLPVLIRGIPTTTDEDVDVEDEEESDYSGMLSSCSSSDLTGSSLEPVSANFLDQLAGRISTPGSLQNSAEPEVHANKKEESSSNFGYKTAHSGPAFSRMRSFDFRQMNAEEGYAEQESDIREDSPSSLEAPVNSEPDVSDLISLDVVDASLISDVDQEMSFRNELHHSMSFSSNGVVDEELARLQSELFLRSVSEDGYDISEHMSSAAYGQPFSVLEEDIFYSDEPSDNSSSYMDPQSPGSPFAALQSPTETYSALQSPGTGTYSALQSPTETYSALQSPGTGTYSITDLTKVELYSGEKEPILTIRERSSCTFKILAQHLRHKIASFGSHLENFTFTLTSGDTVDPQDVLGFTTKQLKVLPANEPDEWKGWRMRGNGRLEQRDRP